MIMIIKKSSSPYEVLRHNEGIMKRKQSSGGWNTRNISENRWRVKMETQGTVRRSSWSYSSSSSSVLSSPSSTKLSSSSSGSSSSFSLIIIIIFVQNSDQQGQGHEEDEEGDQVPFIKQEDKVDDRGELNAIHSNNININNNNSDNSAKGELLFDFEKNDSNVIPTLSLTIHNLWWFHSRQIVAMSI